jgi:hypothetical protein
MTPERAAEVLRYKKLVGPDDWDAARELGAEALEFQSWLFADRPAWEGMRYLALYSQWDGEDSFRDYARAEWEKERKG